LKSGFKFRFCCRFELNCKEFLGHDLAQNNKNTPKIGGKQSHACVRVQIAAEIEFLVYA